MARARVREARTATPRKATRPPTLRSAAASTGSSRRQGSHHEAKKLTTVGRPGGTSSPTRASGRRRSLAEKGGARAGPGALRPPALRPGVAALRPRTRGRARADSPTKATVSARRRVLGPRERTGRRWGAATSTTDDQRPSHVGVEVAREQVGACGRGLGAVGDLTPVDGLAVEQRPALAAVRGLG